MGFSGVFLVRGKGIQGVTVWRGGGIDLIIIGWREEVKGFKCKPCS